MKVIYCLNSIYTVGGIETATIIKANALTQHGIEVFVAVTDNLQNFKTGLSNKVNLINLNIDYYSDDWKSKFKVLKGFIVKRRKHKKVLTQVLNNINPDIVISVGQCEKFFLPEIKGNWKTIREFHYDRKYRIRANKSFFIRLISKLITLYEYKFILPKYNQIVTLTEEDKKSNWKASDNITVIGNPILIPTQTESTNYKASKKIIGVGRLVYQKNFNSMINCVERVFRKYNNWKLEIYGEGGLKGGLKEKVKKLGLENKIIFYGNELDKSKIYSDAAFLIMTSKYEGWGLILTEAMSYGIPTISYSCPCGPKDIIIDGKNGFLVPLDNENLMVEKICFLIENEELRIMMGNYAREYCKNFSISEIIKVWIELFNKLLS